MPAPYNFPVARRDISSPKPIPKTETDILVAGSVAVDLSCDYAPLQPNASVSLVPHTSNPAVITQAIGGVGHNVATAAHLIGNGTTVRLCSFVSNDLAGNVIMSSLKEKGLDVSAIMTVSGNAENTVQTAQYVAINDGNKDLAMAMADMRIISSPMDDFTRWKTTIEASKAKWVVVDSNWDESVMFQWIKEAKRTGASVVVEPVSVEKAKKLFPPKAAKE
jgi:pseudouridylate synthase / pseudouridine kinase